jgi:hypothetical protein
MDGALARLEAARPLLEARGNPTRQYSFYMLRACHQAQGSRLQANEEAVADMRRSLAAARQSRDMKDIGYATSVLGWIQWLHGDVGEARNHLQEALKIADRIGEVALHHHALADLIKIAIGRHDVAAVREMTPRLIEAALAYEDVYHSWAKAPLAWLAWQDGRPGDVVAIAAEIEPVLMRGRAIWNRYRWVHLFPLIAAHLSHSDTERAVTSARPLLDSGQQLLPHDLNAAVEAACHAWDSGRADEAAAGLHSSLDLARNAGFF